MRAGRVYSPRIDDSVQSWWRVIASVVSMAAANMDNQVDRLDRFSLPLLPVDRPDMRANAARTAQLFLSQLRSDYRRVAVPGVELTDVEERRQQADWAARLEEAGIKNCSVAILAVGQYLDSDRTAYIGTALKPWISPEDHSDEVARFENTFGPVVGPVVLLALSEAHDEPQHLPSWAADTGDDWSVDFIKAGAEELRSDQRSAAFAR